LGNAVELIVDGGPSTVGIESTVVALHRHPPVILRPGMISRRELEAASGVAFEFEDDRPEIVESPGQHPRHYAPRTPFFVLTNPQNPPPGRGRVLELPQDPAGFAAALYSELHRADHEGWDWIGVAAPPNTPEWEGICDRLKRASTGTTVKP
jgi:L-threonylcarbamoyladenylate synthase